MGCDIHLHIETKINGKWEHYAAPWINRDYDLFALMANVRNHNDIVPISKPKGLPADISDVTRIEYSHWDRDAHSSTWLDASEIKRLVEAVYKSHEDYRSYISFEHTILNTYLCGNSFSSPCPLYEDVRFVFWFDN